MSDDAYNKKFAEMQKYLPFLRKIIERLKSTNNLDQDNPRKTQLQKMEMLHGLLTSQEKKLKIDTLLKCEGVLKKLHSKMEKSNFFQSNSSDVKANTLSSVPSEKKEEFNPVKENFKVVDITGPSSPPPSPTQTVAPVLPVEIPTERCSPITIDDIPNVTRLVSHNNINSNKNQASLHHSQKKYDQNTSQTPLDQNKDRLSTGNKRSGPERQNSPWNPKVNSRSIPTIITTAPTSSGLFFVTDTHVKNSDKYNWHRKNENPNLRSFEKVAVSTSPSCKSSNSINVPDRKKDEFTRRESFKTSDKSKTTPQSISAVGHEAKGTQREQTIFDKLLGHKYQSDSSAENETGRKVFSRLGAKPDDVSRTRPFENFSINVKNDILKTPSSKPPSQQPSKASFINKSSPALSIPSTKVPQPPLADVLKSPPLTANDISNLLNETVCSAPEASVLNSLSISGIGTRRPPKISTPGGIPSAPASSLDFVRKKFAMITKNSPQFSESPASPPPLIGNVPDANERIALKYNPHPRVERIEPLQFPATCSKARDVATSNFAKSRRNSFVDTPTSPTPTSFAHFNVLPTINLNDPRLKTSNTAPPTHLKEIPSLMDLRPLDMEYTKSMFGPSDRLPPGNKYPLVDSMNRPHRSETHGAKISNQNNFNCKPASKNNVQQPDSPEENWDSDPNETPTVTMKPNVSEQVKPAEKNSPVKTKPPVIPKRSNGYSSEENWDSDPEPSTVNSKIGTTDVNNINIKSQLAPSSVQPSVALPFSKPVHQSSIPTRTNISPQAFGYTHRTENNCNSKPYISPSKGIFVPHTPQQQMNTNSRFSAALNDKTERMKYFESKKQKHFTPRTYAEFKEAKARAASEVTHPPSVTPLVVPQGKEQGKYSTQERTKEPIKDDINKKIRDKNTKDPKVKELPKKCPPPDTNLDKLYRSKSFGVSSDLPKTITNFKIPRKHSETKKTEEEAEKDSGSESAKKEKQVANDNKNKSFSNKEENKLHEKKRTTLDTEKTEPQKEVKLHITESSETTDTEVKRKKRNRRKRNKKSKTNNEETLQKGNENLQHKTDEKQLVSSEGMELKKTEHSITSENTQLKNDQKDIQLQKHENQSVNSEDIQHKKDENPSINSENLQLKKDEELSVNSKDIQLKEATKPTSVDSECSQQKKEEKENKDNENTKEVIGELPTIENIRVNSETREIDDGDVVPNDNDNKIRSQTQAVPELDTSEISEPKTNESNSALNNRDAIPQLSNSSANKTEALLLPRRILRRRCTMFSYASAPEVDKEKIHGENALLFEDLHDHQKRLKQAEELKKRANRKSKNLAEIFQKTDDNCTVSTQNIISGKRRTRTTVNFNEVKQSSAAFRQKKLATDVKKEPKDSDEETESIKVLPKTKHHTPTKKVIKKTNKNVKTKNVDVHSCNVSNISPINVPVTNKKEKDLVSSNEPSNPATPADEEQRKKDLENILQDMNNPNSNREPILKLLRQVCSPVTFDKIKNLLEISAKENIQQMTEADDAEEADDADDAENNEQDYLSLQQSSSQKTNTKKAAVISKPLGKRTTSKKKRTSELDRLYTDIRDMFISEGVMTATGRRMCTLAAIEETKEATTKSQAATNKKNEEPSRKSSSTQDNKDSNYIHIRKSKVIISPLNLNKLRRATPNRNNEELNNGAEDIDENESDIINSKSKLTEQKAEVPLRKMPVLKPNTPIKLIKEERQLEEIEERLNARSPIGRKRKLAKPVLQSKPCPKSKKLQADDILDTAACSRETEEDSDDDLELAHLRKRFKANNALVTTIDKKLQKSEKFVFNTNPHWHALSKYAHWCFFCDAKFLHIAIHYKQKHNNAENYPSRIAPTILQQFKQGKLSTPIFGTKKQQQTCWYYRCPFCLQHSRTLTRSWLQHFIKHTGEYFFECSKCFKTANKSSKMTAHLRDTCPGAKMIRNDYQSNAKLIKAHICHLCNFLQLNRINLERHYMEQHGCSREHVTVLGYSINLFNSDGVELVDEETATKMELAAKGKYSHESVVNIDDDEEEKEEESLRCSTGKTNPAEGCLPNDGETNESNNATEDDHINKEIQSHLADCDKTTTGKNTKTKSNISKAARKKLAKLEADAKKALFDSIKETKISASNRKAFRNSMDELDLEKTDHPQIESECNDKFIADVQDDVLAAAAKAEAEERAREEALRSNIFMPTERNNTDSPTIDCLTESLRTIEQAEEQLQQQQKGSAFNVPNVTSQSSPISKSSKALNSSPSISIAERLSQRFKDIKERSAVEEEPKVPPTDVSFNSSVSGTASTSSQNLIIAEDGNDQDQDKEEEEKQEESDRADQTETKENDAEDDGNWETIEVFETAPKVSSSTSSSGKDKQKKKRIYQSLSRFYANINNKKTSNNKTKKGVANVFVNKKQTTSSSQASSKVRPLLSNLQDLLPDSPCNDPMELVPELAPVEPLQDLSDISSILEANFSALDAQSILQQMDMNITSDTICINADGQQQSIQEALEFETEQQAEPDDYENSDNSNQLSAAAKTSENQLQTVINRVQNLGYSKNTETGTKFYCRSAKCSFLFSNESFGLESHFLSEHPHMGWSGFCSICNKQIVQQTSEQPNCFPISQEMQHMLDVHVQINEETVQQNREDVHRDDEETTQSSITKADSMPRIKLRRLTGDCLSTTSTTLPQSAEESQPPKVPQLPALPKDLTNISLSDLLRAERRPVSIRPIMENEKDEDALPLFKNIGNDFTITSVASGATELGAPLQISNVRSLRDCSEPTIINIEPSSTFPKISNVCSLNANANSRKTPNSVGLLWQKQIETDRIELEKAGKESVESCRIINDKTYNRRGPPNDKIGHLFTEAMRDSDSPTLVAETLPVSTATSGDFLITQTISTQYDENLLNGPKSAPQLGISISIAPKTNQVQTERTTTTTSEEVPAPIRSQFKCMGNFCKYQTSVSVAMIEHLRFHERRNFSTQREYLRCSFCEHISDDVELYIKHAVEQHPIQLTCNDSQNSVKTAASKCPITQKIQDILRVNHEGRRSSSSSNSNDTTSTPAELPFTLQLRETLKEMVASTGLPDSKLYRCVVEGCKTVLNEESFHTHIIYHLTTLGINVNNYSYKCPHCVSVYQRPNGIKAHIKSHARHKIICFQCMGTTNSIPQMVKHFCEKHWKISTLNTAPLLSSDSAAVADSNAKDSDHVVAYAGRVLTLLDVQQFGEKLIAEWQGKKAAAKTHFKHSEIHLLPIQPIFRNEVFCAECFYKTKVRTNMYRHLQLHKTSSTSSVGSQLRMASVDPVNPVPCLNSSERHFDKMCNLASSSLATGAAANTNSTKSNFKPPYVYVSEMRRYTCGVAGCQYLTVSDEIFRSHLSALHQNLSRYCCPFCKEELTANQRSPPTERILQHLRMHGSKLYQCKECDYFHYMKGVVERHINDRHAASRVILITHERSVDGAAEGTKITQTITGKKFKEPAAVKPTASSEYINNTCNPTSSAAINANSTTTNATAANSKLKWECDLCKHRTTTHNQMVHHCSVQHSCKHQYQCVHCQFGATQLVHIMTHIDEKHPSKTREARYIFHKIFSSAQEKEAATRPLWQRDDPTRVRHIRGILMEDEEESEQFGKQLDLDGENGEEFEEFVSLSDEVGTRNNDNDFNTVQNNKNLQDVTSEENKSKFFELSCYHCDFKSRNFDNLKNHHWKTAHNSIPDVSKPFFFRLLKTLKCSECGVFKGDHNSLQVHLQDVHKIRIFFAADAEVSNQNICAYCDFNYTSTDQLIRHYSRIGHKPQDIKNFSPEMLETFKQLGTSETYLQCMLCMDLFANRMAIIQHINAKHKYEGNFSFKEQRNQIIYRCAMCSFAAPGDELATLRHMIEHYGGFKYCYFCRESQASFNGYMQHCYSEHREEIKRFSEIYTLKAINKYMQHLVLIFPNGFVINKKNLCKTEYGCNKNIDTIYKEICKISQEPPIPRLSIARLVARKSIEAKQASRNASPNLFERPDSASLTAAALHLESNIWKQTKPKKISKRRQTVAFGDRNEFDAEANVSLKEIKSLAAAKKRKISENILSSSSSYNVNDESVPTKTEEQPYSFYGKKMEPVDLTKIYTNVAIGGLDTPLTIDKFKKLFQIDAQVVLDKLDIEEIGKNTNTENPKDYGNVKKACPASQKFKYI